MSSAYWNDLARHTDLDEIWMSHPLVRARINERVSGRAEVWPTNWLREQLTGRLPLKTTMSIGCGIGNLERDLAAQEVIDRCVGVDTADHCIDAATSRARGAGLGDRLTYRRVDARTALAAASGLDAVFFHGSLHHFAGHEELLRLVSRVLSPGGILYIDEYVGPSRDEWHEADLLIPNIIYRILPSSVRRARVVRAPINREDPTEAVESSKILPAIERVFPRVIRRDYGGNLLSLLYPNMRRPAAESPERDDLNRAVRRLLDLEELILRHRRLLRTETYFSVVLAQREARD